MNTDQFEEDYSDLKMCLSHPRYLEKEFSYLKMDPMYLTWR